MEAAPTVSIVFLVYNRRDELRISLRKMLHESDYPRDRVDVIVVDNASEDGAAEMVREEFPEVQLIRREVNSGVSAMNDGWAVARGDYVLGLDDDCYLPPDGLRRAIALAQEHEADLVSFGVATPEDPEHRFDHRYRTGLLSYWGCAVLIRREVVRELVGYDPEIFVWANELEFMLRFFDAGYRHLHAPEIIAWHMKAVGGHWTTALSHPSYVINAEHFAYVAAKLMRRRDAAEALIALLATSARNTILYRREAAKALPAVVRGFAHGLRHRAPVGNAKISRTYRHCFESYASPWWLTRPPLQLLASLPGRVARKLLRRPERGERHPGRRELYYEERARYYPSVAATLEIR